MTQPVSLRRMPGYSVVDARAPRYGLAVNRAHECLSREGGLRFPVDVAALIDRFNVRLYPYSALAALLNVGTGDIARVVRTQDAALITLGGRHTIVYNDAMPRTRVRFSLMHELGHIALGHADTAGRPPYIEREADCFARNILAPPMIALHLIKLMPEHAHTLLCISRTAWAVRRALLTTDAALLTPAHRLSQRARLASGALACARCGAPLARLNARYCPVCGSRHYCWKDKPMLYNDGYKLDAYARVAQCPRCGNEELAEEAQFCKICGAPLYNRCTYAPCQVSAEGNARYCILCGNATTFLAAGLLAGVGATGSVKTG